MILKINPSVRLFVDRWSKLNANVDILQVQRVGQDESDFGYLTKILSKDLVFCPILPSKNAERLLQQATRGRLVPDRANLSVYPLLSDTFDLIRKNSVYHVVVFEQNDFKQLQQHCILLLKVRQ